MNVCFCMNALSACMNCSVRVKAQPALISLTRRYQSACARLVPALVAILEDTSNSGHAYEQSVVGAANLLQTGLCLSLSPPPLSRSLSLSLCLSESVWMCR